MPQTTTAALVETAGAPFSLAEVELDDPRPDEVVVRVTAAGICHTDLGVAAGALPFPLPGVLGHEGAGIVEAVGSAVTRVRPGDQVLLSFTSCGRCANCRDGHPAYCLAWLPLNLLGGARADGSATVRKDGAALGSHFFGQSSFARLAVVDERSLVRVPEGAPLDLLAPLGCGVQTGFGAVVNVLRPRPGATIVVTGAGAVGLSAVMAARLTPATRIIAVDRVPDRLELAVQLGATDTLDTSSLGSGSAGLAAALADLTGGHGADGVIETTGNALVLGEAINALAVRGCAVVVGAPAFGTQVPVDVNFLLPGRTVTGLTLGDSETETLLPTLVDLVAAGRLPVERLVRHYKFEDINTAVADMVAGTAVKPVLTF
ncbi:MAG TPA: NAD(P)-dependent alcohol dehydrogenase [Actinocrinis sp.]|uniref:NAD(P)-dependent alcohol dehydrogenase n=1 Tax=Actinocrinis sp. TaxID=1920516 RepID=UPI002D44EA65|nr:NAD(P)-dependent alcohol dehydrogenase [Actinocrinis sp.]HZU56988.1 NAD(P)-dependent alcohol dehydrogenase [Actinocrinis sp.]